MNVNSDVILIDYVLYYRDFLVKSGGREGTINQLINEIVVGG